MMKCWDRYGSICRNTRDNGFQDMSKRKRISKKRKAIAMSAFGLRGAADYYETAPLYQRKFEQGDMRWLADEYRKLRDSESSPTLEEFAAQHGVPPDELRTYIPELEEGISRSVVVWHGTSKSRAKSILKEGFRSSWARNAQLFFSRDPAVARRYAEARAGRENDKPALLTCSIDLSRYNCCERRKDRDAAVVFKHKLIGREVVKRVTMLVRGQHEKEKREKQRNTSVELTNVTLTFNSEHAGIAYWINSCLNLEGPNAIGEDHEAVGKIKQWLHDQTEAGRFGEVPDDEMLEKVREYLPQYFS